MSEKLSKHQVLSYIAEHTGVTKKVAGEMLDALVELAYKEACNQFTIPGLGVIALSDRPARKMIMRFGPRSGQEIDVPAKQVLKFRFSKAAKEAILHPAKDDLALIEGIGPKIAEALNHAGVFTFRQLAATPVETLHHVLDEAKFPGEPGTWAEQAQLAADGKMEELQKLQDELKGGRRA